MLFMFFKMANLISKSESGLETRNSTAEVECDFTGALGVADGSCRMYSNLSVCAAGAAGCACPAAAGGNSLVSLKPEEFCYKHYIAGTPLVKIINCGNTAKVAKALCFCGSGMYITEIGDHCDPIRGVAGAGNVTPLCIKHVETCDDALSDDCVVRTGDGCVCDETVAFAG